MYISAKLTLKQRVLQKLHQSSRRVDVSKLIAIILLLSWQGLTIQIASASVQKVTAHRCQVSDPATQNCDGEARIIAQVNRFYERLSEVVLSDQRISFDSANLTLTPANDACTFSPNNPFEYFSDPEVRQSVQNTLLQAFQSTFSDQDDPTLVLFNDAVSLKSKMVQITAQSSDGDQLSSFKFEPDYHPRVRFFWDDTTHFNFAIQLSSITEPSAGEGKTEFGIRFLLDRSSSFVDGITLTDWFPDTQKFSFNGSSMHGCMREIIDDPIVSTDLGYTGIEKTFEEDRSTAFKLCQRATRTEVCNPTLEQGDYCSVTTFRTFESCDITRTIEIDKQGQERAK